MVFANPAGFGDYFEVSRLAGLVVETSKGPQAVADPDRTDMVVPEAASSVEDLGEIVDELVEE